MGTLHKLPAGMDYQGRHETRRARWAEQEWRDTMAMPRSVPLQRITKKRSRVESFCRLLVLATVCWAGFFLAAFLIAALVA